jgi:hypothetical protein
MSWEPLKDTFPKARRRYRCSGCWEFIEVGEQHRYQVGVFDGDFQANRWHEECHEFAGDTGGFDEGVIPGSFSRAEAIAHCESTNPTEPGKESA